MTADKLRREIAGLQQALNASASGSRVDWKNVWADIKGIGASFKGAEFSSREERENAWSLFQNVVGQIKEQQARHREKQEQLASGSSRHLDHIRSLTDAASPDDGLADILITVFTAGANLALKAGLDALLGHHDEMFAELHRRSAALREAGQYLSAHKAEMLGRDKAAAFESIKSQRERLDADWSAWKSAIQEAKQKRHEDYLERQAKREAWRENQNAYVARLEGALERLDSARSRRREHLGDLREKRDSAWSDGYREKVEGWIDEEEQNIADIESKMRDVADKLEEAKSKL